MSLTNEEIISAAMKLDPIEREALAEQLLLSLDANERDRVQREWLAEAHRRLAAWKAGNARTESPDDAIARIRSKASR